MPATVYTLVCETERSRHLVGVFADRARAAEIARGCAAASAENLRRQDREIFKAPVAPDLYEVLVEDLGSTLNLLVRHRFLDTRPRNRWQIQQFEVEPETGVKSTR